jgi:4-phytase/acid phosphatase
MARLILALAALCALAGLALPAVAEVRLERVVLVQRHGVRPPTVSNAELAKYSDRPWPAWPVGPGELTPHGGKVVALLGKTLRKTYTAAGLIPAHGCAGAGRIAVWADNADERTRHSGQVLAESLAPGCGVKAAWSDAKPRDPIFGAPTEAACHADPADDAAAFAKAAGPDGSVTPKTRAAIDRLQLILAPKACSGGAGLCLASIPGPDKVEAGPGGAKFSGPVFTTFALAEDIYLEYAEGMPMSDVGWGRASRADIDAIMPAHERFFELLRLNTFQASRRGAAMARVILASLAGEPIKTVPAIGPDARLVALAGHDGNLSQMAGVFGLNWSLPQDQPDATAPATTLAFELWKDTASGETFVRPVLYYATLDQLRTLAPAIARKLPLQFDDCASGPMGSCSLETVRKRVEALLPEDCGEI